MAAKTASLSVNIIADAAKARAGLKEAETAFGKFRREVNESQGAMGKFRTISGSAFDYVKQNAMAFAATAGAAIATFVVKSVTAFADLSLAAGKFADATGLTTQEASRFMEVAGDLGVESKTLETALNRLNRSAADGAKEFGLIGAQIVRTSSGAVDVQKTFFNVIDALRGIEDPAVRAKAATALLGRGWQELAEIVEGGSGRLEASLRDVADVKVIDPEEVARAREFRANMDNLKDSFEEFSLSLGRNLLPVVSSAIRDLGELLSVLDRIPGGQEAMNSKAVESANVFQKASFWTAALLENVLGLSDETSQNVVVTEDMARVWGDGYRAMIDARIAADELGTAIENQKWSVEDAKLAWDIYRGALNFKVEMDQIALDIEEFRTDSTKAFQDGKLNADEYGREMDRLKLRVANFGSQVLTTASQAAQNVIQVLVNTGQLEKALSLLRALQAGTLGINKTATGTYYTTPYGSMPLTLNQIPARAMGGMIMKPEVSLVGEDGPEVIIPLSKPARAMELMQQSGLSQMALGSMSSGGGTTVIQIQVDAGLVSSPDQVGQQIIEAIRRAERRSGQVFANV